MGPDKLYGDLYGSFYCMYTDSSHHVKVHCHRAVVETLLRKVYNIPTWVEKQSCLTHKPSVYPSLNSKMV